MAKLFMRGPGRGKNPVELAMKASQTFEKIPYESSSTKIVDELAKTLQQIRDCIYGEEEGRISSSRENAMLFATEACKQQLPEKMAEFLGELDFESRKIVVQIFSTVMRIQIGTTYPGLVYIREHPRLLDVLFEGYSDPQVALNYGQMIRECLRHEEIAQDFLRSALFKELIIKLEVDEFDVASDAFLTFKDVLTRHKHVVAQYLTENYSDFVGCYRALLESQNYVTRRQSVKLLGELLLDRENVKAMMRYVSEVDNLVLMMNLLKDSSKSIQFEAFHVFKVFVANPKKTSAIAEVLYKNKDKLLRYLADFHNDRDDKLFKEEKEVIIREIEELQPPA